MQTSSIIDELGPLAIAARLQRLADTIRKDGAMIYKQHGIDFEPRWFPIIYTLKCKAPLGIVELANEIGYAHPSVISLVKELQQRKLVRSVKDKKDERKRLLSLTPAAQELIEKMQPVWSDIRQSAQEITDTPNNLMKALEETENNLKRESFLLRTQKIGLRRRLRIVDYQKKYQPDFKRINVAWISKSFVVEDVDLVVLDNPEKNIIKKGGHIILALIGENVVGTCALLKGKPGVYEMAKMAVDDNYRGLKIGRLLGEAVIEKARKLGAKKVQLFSNTKGSAVAVELYRKLGFKEIPLDTKAYARADIKMEIVL